MLLKGIITKKSPIYVQFAVTKRCNLNCEMCASSISRKDEKELSLPEIKKLADVLDKLNVGVILLTGGEPFIRNDISEIIRIFSQKGFTVRLQTNGLLATEGKIREVYQADMKEITISLDFLDPEKQDAVTGQNGSWHKIIESIARFSQILPKKNTLLGINVVVSRQNLKELPDIIKFITKIGFYASLIPIHISHDNNEEFIIRKRAPEFDFNHNDFDEIDQVYEKIIKMKKQGYNIYNSYKFLRQSPAFLKHKKVKWDCDSPYLYFAISPSGKFFPCVDLITSYSMIDDNFVDLYNSKEFKSEIDKKVKRCPGCFYACWPEISFLCRDPWVFAERTLLVIKSSFKERKPVTYEQCLKIIEEIKNSK
ncbi:radical SAM protein [Candidatus Omnitrophota bacterium]